MESKCQDETLRMQGMNLNLCILHMSEDTSPLGVARIWSNGSIYSRLFISNSKGLTETLRDIRTSTYQS